MAYNMDLDDKGGIKRMGTMNTITIDESTANAKRAGWNPADGTGTGYVSLAEVRRAPYHRSFAESESSAARALADSDLSALHSRDWECTVHAYDTQAGYEYMGEDEQCNSSFTYGSGEYDVSALESFRSRVLESSVPRTGRLIVIENVLPPVMEVVGASMKLDPALFATHVEHAWNVAESSLGMTGGQVLHGPPGKTLTFTMQYPRVLEVNHPSAWANPDWRADCLRRASKFLQCQEVMPIWDVLEESKVQCVAMEHVTVQFELLEKGKWQGVVMFPYSFTEWREGHLHIIKHVNAAPIRPYLLDNEESPSKNIDGIAGAWLRGIRGCESDVLMGVLSMSEQLFQEGLYQWRIHLQHVAKAVSLLSSSSNTTIADENTLRIHSQVRAVIVRGAMVLSESIDALTSLQAWIQRTAGTSPYRHPNMSEYERAAQFDIQHVRDDFALLKTQLERHLPTLQHHIDMTVIRQQVRLQETQLEESRKAIQQADTIKRLTILAFIYIPVQTASSIFGMNVREIAPSGLSVWVFVLTAVVLLALTLSAAGWQSLRKVLLRGYSRAADVVDDAAGAVADNLGVQVRLRRRAIRQAAGVDERMKEPSWII